MPTMTLERPAPKAFGNGFAQRQAPAAFTRRERSDPWAAHNASSHIPNAETREAIEDAMAGRNMHGPFKSVDEMFAELDK